MPNGKPGDDWFTDIVSNGLPTFSPAVDALVVELNDLIPEARPPELIGLVKGFLAGIGYETLAQRNAPTVGMEYRQLSEIELARLEEALSELHGAWSRHGRGAF